MYFRPGLEYGGRHHSQRSPYRSVGRWGDGGGVRRWRRQPRRGRRQRRRRRRRRQFAQAAGASSGYRCGQGGRGQRFPRARVPGLGGWGENGTICRRRRRRERRLRRRGGQTASADIARTVGLRPGRRLALAGAGIGAARADGARAYAQRKGRLPVRVHWSKGGAVGARWWRCGSAKGLF